VNCLQNANKKESATPVFVANDSSTAIPTSRLKNLIVGVITGLLRNIPEHSNPEAKLCAIPTRLYLAL
jgi:hypothetical protein